MKKLVKIVQEAGSDNNIFNIRKLFKAYNEMVDVINKMNEKPEIIFYNPNDREQ